MIEKLADKLEAAPATPPPGALEPVAKLLGSMMQSNVDLVGSMGDLAVRSVARRNGIRGGTSNARTAQRDKEGKFLPKSARRRRDEPRTPRCPLCAYGENYPGVTIDMIKEHRAHLQAREERSRWGDEYDDGRDEHRAEEPGDNGESSEHLSNGSSNGPAQ